jgi:putative SOS response-associated peptidase YedK
MGIEDITRVQREGVVLPHGWAPAITQEADAVLQLRAYHWWLIPGWWKKDLKSLPSAFNAKSETVATLPMFRGAWKSGRRCIIPADYFLEGRKPSVARIERADGAPILFAGIWEQWKPPEGETLRSCTMLTTTPNELMSTVHHRMPVILAEADLDEWLSPDTKPADAQHLLRPCPSEWLTVQPT